jgi:hypothetical protein
MDITPQSAYLQLEQDSTEDEPSPRITPQEEVSTPSIGRQQKTQPPFLAE